MARSKYERLAQKQLEAEGYLVDWKIRPPSFAPKGYQTDIFGLFDLMAVQQDCLLRFISIKGKAGIPGEHRQAVEDFWLPECCMKEIWYWKGKTGWSKNIVGGGI